MWYTFLGGFTSGSILGWTGCYIYLNGRIPSSKKKE